MDSPIARPSPPAHLQRVRSIHFAREGEGGQHVARTPRFITVRKGEEVRIGARARGGCRRGDAREGERIFHVPPRDAPGGGHEEEQGGGVDGGEIEGGGGGMGEEAGGGPHRAHRERGGEGAGAHKGHTKPNPTKKALPNGCRERRHHYRIGSCTAVVWLLMMRVCVRAPRAGGMSNLVKTKGKNLKRHST